MNSWAIIGIGNSGSGKTVFTQVAGQMLDKMGLRYEKLDDRTGLVQAVRLDVGQHGQAYYREKYPNARTGKHSILLDPKTRQVEVLDGKLLNAVHDQMAWQIYNKPGFYVVEWAVGNNFDPGGGREVLQQDGQSVVDRLIHYWQDEVKVIVVEFDSNFQVRAERNAARKDGLSEETFAMLFQDGGELGIELVSGFPDGVSYINFDNNYQYRDDEEFVQMLREFCEEEIKPLIENYSREVERR